MAHETANVVSIPGWPQPNQFQTNTPALLHIQDPRCMQIIVPLPIAGETVVRVKSDGSYTVKVNAPEEEA